MPCTHYKIWSVGRPVGQGVMDSLNVGVAGIAKCATKEEKYAVINELVCGQLAKVLLLPVPPSFLISHNSTPYHVSLNFNLAGQSLPPADSRKIVANHLELSWGILLFDSWILNPDRHPRNIAYDTTQNKVQIFDHGHALIRGNDVSGRLEVEKNGLGFAGHCLAAHVDGVAGLKIYSDMIQKIPDYYIRKVIESTINLGVSSDEVKYLIDYLLDRRKNLIQMMKDNRQIFTKIADDEWDRL